MGEPKIGLALSAGGIAGSAWLTGALIALQAETGWLPAGADIILGTSAGSVIGSMCAAGIDPQLMPDLALGLPGRRGHVELVGARSYEGCTGTEFTLAAAGPPVGPGSWRLALSSLLHPNSRSPAALISGLLPRGMLSTNPITRLIDRAIAEDWPRHPTFWAVACDYRNGERVVFGAPGKPRTRVAQAVAASCAVPGFYHPVAIGDRHYVDGGVCSLSNLDVLSDSELDLVLCLSPMSSPTDMPVRGVAAGLAAGIRAFSGRKLRREATALRKTGTEVTLIEPTGEDIELIGTNPMARGRTLEIVERARVSTTLSLRTMAERGDALPTANTQQAAPATRFALAA